MPSWIWWAAGALLIATALVDLYLTAIAAAGGGGPVTRLLSWSLWRAAVAVPFGSVHRRLQGAGHLILIAVVLAWLVLIWSGFALWFLSEPASVISSTSKQPAGLVAKLAFTAGALAGAGAGFVASSGGWEALNNLAAILGLSWATLTLTYLLQVVTAASQRRALALRILGIADDPVAMAAIGAGRDDLGQLGQHLTNITQDVALMARYHEALPTLRHFHTGRRLDAIEIGLAVLDEALTILAAAHRGLPPVARPMRTAIHEFLRTTNEHVDAPAPEPPPLARLRESGIDVGEERLHRATEAVTDHRRALHALLRQRGWSWEADVLRSGT